MSDFGKKGLALRYWLLGKGYYMAVDAMEFAATKHIKTRKDGVTPEFMHQIEIVHFLRTLPDLTNREEVLAVGFLHDVREDCGISDHEIRTRYGDIVADGTETMTKKFRGVSKPYPIYFEELSHNAEGSICKGVDRDNNFGSMIGVFSHEKQVEYLGEGDTYFLPMLKKARRRFPKQEAAYENIKFSLKSKMTLIREIHKAGNN